jgi:hypothetical protein
MSQNTHSYLIYRLKYGLQLNSQKVIVSQSVDRLN